MVNDKEQLQSTPDSVACKGQGDRRSKPEKNPKNLKTYMQQQKVKYTG